MGRDLVTIGRDRVLFTLSGADRPAAAVASGATVVFATADCYNGQITDEDILHSAIRKDTRNPATGPLYVEGAAPGGMLKIDILDIKVADRGVMTARPGDGVLRDRFPSYKTKVVPIAGGTAVFDAAVSLPVVPMIGVIGVAPAGDPVLTVVPGPHGGNLDCKRIGKGASVYLPVAVPGGLLSMGDLHAVMADGEVLICGLEVAGEVTVRVTALPGQGLPLPLVATADSVITLASAATLDEAATLATLAMQDLFTRQAAIGTYDAAMLLSLVGELNICQVVNPLKTCRMELPRHIFAAYGGTLPE